MERLKKNCPLAVPVSASKPETLAALEQKPKVQNKVTRAAAFLFPKDKEAQKSTAELQHCITSGNHTQ